MAVLDRLFATESAVSDLRHPTAWLMDSFGVAKTSTGITVGPDKAMSLATYYACIRNTSEDCAKLPFKVYEKKQPRGKAIVTDHPTYRIIHDEPNPEMTPITFWELLFAWALGWGNGVAIIVFDGDRPRDLWPVHPSRITIKRDRTTNEIVYDMNLPGGSRTAFTSYEVIHLRGFGDDTQGWSVARVGAESIARGLAIQDYVNRFYADGTTAAGVFTMPGKLSLQAQEQLRKTWPRGLPNAHRPLFFEGDMKWTPLSVNPVDAEMVSTMHVSVIDVCRWFRMPPSKVQELQDAKYANIEQQSIDYVTDTLLGWLTRCAQEVNRKLFRENERGRLFAEHNVTGLLRGDSAARSAYYRTMFSIGSLSPNDIRELENQDDLGPDGDRYMLPLNMVPADKLDEQMDKPKAAPPGGVALGKQPTQDDAEQNADKAMRTVRACCWSIAAEADRLTRREAKTVESLVRKHEGNGADEAVRAWYRDEFCGFMADALTPHARVAADMLGAMDPAAPGSWSTHCADEYCAVRINSVSSDIGPLLFSIGTTGSAEIVDLLTSRMLEAAKNGKTA